uniref:Uncharacterized protein n=1 Tax=Sexangularia sp. CB-2014 TaxID=1486929 RepID=A0A7S1VKC4_9EUKA
MLLLKRGPGRPRKLGPMPKKEGKVSRKARVEAEAERRSREVAESYLPLDERGSDSYFDNFRGTPAAARAARWHLEEVNMLLDAFRHHANYLQQSYPLSPEAMNFKLVASMYNANFGSVRMRERTQFDVMRAYSNIFSLTKRRINMREPGAPRLSSDEVGHIFDDTAREYREILGIARDGFKAMLRALPAYRARWASFAEHTEPLQQPSTDQTIQVPEIVRLRGSQAPAGIVYRNVTQQLTPLPPPVPRPAAMPILVSSTTSLSRSGMITPPPPVPTPPPIMSTHSASPLLRRTPSPVPFVRQSVSSH